MNDNGAVPNPALREAATQTAFNLTLSKNMVQALNTIAHGDRQLMSPAADRRWVPTMWDLKRRGLVIHVTDPEGWGRPLDEPDQWNRTRALTAEAQKYDCGINAMYRLSRAGWLMHDLLAEAGLVDRVTSRKQRKMVA